MAFTATITSKGQITIPREARKVLDSTTVEIEVLDGELRLRPVRSVAGALAAFAGPTESLAEIRDKVWSEVARAQK